MKKRFKAIGALSMSLALVLTACGGGNNGAANGEGNADGQTGAETPKQEVVLNIPHYKAGQNVGGKFFLPQVERFNAKYDGQYEIRIEEVPNDAYKEKIKLLWQQNKLPALIEGGDTQFIEELIKRDQIYDLKPWLDSKPELSKQLIEDSVAYNTRDGKIYTMPLSVIRPIGLFYNKEMFEKAGITKPIAQMTFAEFEEALKQLQAAGFTPLSLMTGENAWTTMLLASAFMAAEPGGADVLKSDRADKITNYNDPLWIKAFAETQKWLQNYTTGNAIGAAYADAANNFLNERAAIIANGTWMVGDFSDTTKAPEGFEKKVGASLYPGGVGLATTAEFSWWIPKGLKEEETQAALAFLEFINSPEELEAYMIAEGGQAPNLTTSADFESKLNPILAGMNQSVSSDLKIIAQSFGNAWPDAIASTEFAQNLPLLANGTLTPEKFAETLTQKASKFK
ncbi:ABC transporter substrate-binding protein [Paenibacillus sp.]|uniref:ABC transporter substrate-binding protein n=1 Tax=Paenibacillus sp. TaxID=58172 RepID=UPI002D398250|nr:ABC transporter substrate-binding protein [Paenibacillus sp.]HZG84340.1 ABC transporter substrate-binding protein [Paenibacillus sp.]